MHIDYPVAPLFNLLIEAARKFPDGVAFSCLGKKLTYSQLDLATGKLAGYLRETGIKTGDRVVIFLPNGLEFVISYYAILKAGAIVSPANPLYKEAEIKYQLNDLGAAAIITSSEYYPLIKNIKTGTGVKFIMVSDASGFGDTIGLDDALTGAAPVYTASDINPKDDAAAIEFTGGTTGLSKGAVLTHYNLFANAIQNAAWFKWGRDDVIIAALPFYHSWGACTCMNSPLYAGSRVVIVPHFDAETILETISREKATVLYGAVTMFSALADHPEIGRYDISSLRYVKAGAMPIPAGMKEKWEKATGVKMVFGYGLSEASPEVADSPLERVKNGTVGIPLMDTDAMVVNSVSGNPGLPPGETGELIVRGPQVMKGYWNRPEETYIMRGGWLYTGDIAFMDEEGYIHITDRKKEIIKYKGYTIAPAEVESVIYEHPAVKECAVIGKPSGDSGEIPKAYVVTRAGCILTEGELIEFCKERLAPFKRVREVEFIAEIPKSAVGKVLRRVLKERAGEKG